MKNEQGMTFIEVMLVVAILGILATIAMLTYVNFVAAARQSSAKFNCTAGQNFIKAEISKRASGTGLATDNALRDLNTGGKKSPYDPTSDAYVTVLVAGAVRIVPVDIAAQATGTQIIIECDRNGDAVADETTSLTVE